MSLTKAAHEQLQDDFEAFEEDFATDMFAMAPISFLMIEMIETLRSRESQLRALALAIGALDHGRRHGLALAERGFDRTIFDRFVDRLRAAADPGEEEIVVAQMVLTLSDAHVAPVRQLLMLLDVLARLEDDSGDGPEGLEEKFDRRLEKLSAGLYQGEPRPQVARRPRLCLVD